VKINNIAKTQEVIQDLIKKGFSEYKLKVSAGELLKAFFLEFEFKLTKFYISL
jgi:hypothetical protein